MDFWTNYECPHCRKKIDASEITQGEQITCPNCQGEINPSDFWMGPPVKKKYMAWKTVFFILIFGLIIGASIFVVNDVCDLRIRVYDASAKSAGRNAKLAQEVCFDGEKCPGLCRLPEFSRAYYNDLSDLLSFDKNITDDPEVTFTFGECNCTGYTFTTQHTKSTNTFIFTD